MLLYCSSQFLLSNFKFQAVNGYKALGAIQKSDIEQNVTIFGAKKRQLNNECRTGNIEYRSVDVSFKLLSTFLRNSTFLVLHSILS
jgi:hypothetical protein